MTTATASSVEQLAGAYACAWDARDVDAILDLHTADSVFHLHLTGGEPAVGADAVRAAFALLFEQYPDLASEPVRLQHGADHWVQELRMSATANGAKVEFDLIDVLSVRDGLVARKDSYIDALAVQAALTAA